MTVDNVPHCNQWHTDSKEYYKPVYTIGDEECLTLREEFRKHIRKSRPWQETA